MVHRWCTVVHREKRERERSDISERCSGQRTVLRRRLAFVCCSARLRSMIRTRAREYQYVFFKAVRFSSFNLPSEFSARGSSCLRFLKWVHGIYGIPSMTDRAIPLVTQIRARLRFPIAFGGRASVWYFGGAAGLVCTAIGVRRPVRTPLRVCVALRAPIRMRTQLCTHAPKLTKLARVVARNPPDLRHETRPTCDANPTRPET